MADWTISTLHEHLMNLMVWNTKRIEILEDFATKSLADRSRLNAEITALKEGAAFSYAVQQEAIKKAAEAIQGQRGESNEGWIRVTSVIGAIGAIVAIMLALFRR